MTAQFQESLFNLIAENTQLEGKLEFSHSTKVFGRLIGEIHTTPGSILILGENSSVRGNIHADTIIVDGFVEGDITAQTRIELSGTARVIGKLHCTCLKVHPGAFLEGEACVTANAPSDTTRPSA